MQPIQHSTHRAWAARGLGDLILVGALATALLGSVACSSSPAPGTPARERAELITCEMSFELTGWSAIVRKADGRGSVRCQDGSSAEVTLRVRGGGLTAGKTEILDGTGTFSGVFSIDEIFGSYVAAAASAGAVRSGEAVAMTKGPVSLALAGTGRGWSLGVEFNRFVIRRASN